MKYFKKFADSSKELGNVKSLAVCAMMLALRIVLGIFANNLLPMIPFSAAKVNLTFIPVMLTAYLYGPVCTAVVAGAGDIFSYLLAPTAAGFNPAITACYILEGLIYGVVLYHDEMTVPRVIVAKTADLLLCTLTTQTFILKALYYPTVPLSTLLLIRTAVLVPMAVIEVVFILLMKKPLLSVRKQLNKT